MEKTYIDYLRDEMTVLKESGGDFDRELLHFPDLIKLLCDILDEDIVDRESRSVIYVALGYLVVPNDVVPEEVYGAYGYMDDMYVSCIVLHTLMPKYPYIIKKLWNSDEDLKEVLDICTFKCEKFLDEKNLKEKLLRYCGFSE